MLLKISTIALIPALIVQGNKVKKNTLRLPEPEGEREGITGIGKPLSILIIGDSAAAGVGVNKQEDALLGSVITELKDQFEITWKLQAKTGDASSQVIKTVQALQEQHYDVVLTSVGVNDVTKLMPSELWIKKQQHLYRIIEEKFSPNLIIAAGVPPMNMFPALPNPLAWLFGQYAKKMNQQLAELVKKRNTMEWIEYDIQKYQALNLEMAEDGFHPSKEVYQLWAKEVADKIRQKF
ncbi:MAG: SGNH/GDSL hydrolase family protein [Acinetobacter sp.]